MYEQTRLSNIVRLVWLLYGQTHLVCYNTRVIRLVWLMYDTSAMKGYDTDCFGVMATIAESKYNQAR